MAKLRVHELAKELGITSKELMGHLKEAGEFVKSSSSSLEPPVVRQMRERFAAAPKTKNAEAKPTAHAPKPGAAKPAAKKATTPAEATAEAAPKPGGRKPAEAGAPKPAPRRTDAPRPRSEEHTSE
ncbi:translation initiation factor IF-2 N-terminal domain-containing protein, partial [Schaalia odontolytica]|uniref:translation initiation factor IF-2 N-terminal domain-containing protein n=1 Tax=Schaalia odontolytica TaxID=1660 RepID=UPI003C7227D3